MKKTILKRILAASAAWALLAPAAFAAYNDVSLTSDTVVNIAGVEIDVSGSTAAIESIIVNDTSFTIGLQSGSTIEVTVPGLNQLSTDTTADLSANTCTSHLSQMAYTATAARTITITPSMSALCGTGSGGGGSSSSGSSTSSVVHKVATSTPSAVKTATTTTATVTPALSVSPKMTSAIVTSVFTHDLKAGSSGSDVKALQVWLNTHGYVVATSGAGSLGNESTSFGARTKAALAKFQKAKGISPAVGYFGPLTRAALQALP